MTARLNVASEHGRRREAAVEARTFSRAPGRAAVRDDVEWRAMRGYLQQVARVPLLKAQEDVALFRRLDTARARGASDPERERTVLRLRFGIRDDREYTLQEIAERVGLSRERIRQIERQALAQLRRRRRQFGLESQAA